MRVGPRGGWHRDRIRPITARRWWIGGYRGCSAPLRYAAFAQPVVNPSLAAASLAMLKKNAVISDVDRLVVVACNPSMSVVRTLGSQPLSCIAEPPTAIAIAARIIRIPIDFRFITLLLHAAYGAGRFIRWFPPARRCGIASARRLPTDTGISDNRPRLDRLVLPIGPAAVTV